MFSPFSFLQQQSVAPPTPSYVTSGLILYWDGANYSGTGNWLDLSGNGNHGTFNGQPVTGSTDFGGVVYFNGINSNCVNTSVSTVGSDFTVMYAGQYVSGWSRGRMCSSYNCNSYNTQLGHWGTYTNTLYLSSWYKSGTIQNYDWSIQAATREGSPTSASSYKKYFNNVYEGPDGGFAPNGGSEFGGISIASYGDYSGSAGEFSTCNVGFVMMYNRALSESELTQNYNYFKNRYGL